MKSLKLLCILGCLFEATLKAQESDYKLSLVTMGVSMNILEQYKLTLYGGISDVYHQNFFRASPTFKINQYLSFSPTYTYSDLYKDHHDNIEHHLMPNLNISISLDKNQKWSLTNRNMYFYKIRSQKSNTSFYRNRIGLNYKTKIAKQTTNFFINEEIYLNLEGEGLYRNQISVGASAKLPWLTPQIMYTHQINKNSKTEHLFNLSFVIPLENFGFFNHH